MNGFWSNGMEVTISTLATRATTTVVQFVNFMSLRSSRLVDVWWQRWPLTSDRDCGGRRINTLPWMALALASYLKGQYLLHQWRSWINLIDSECFVNGYIQGMNCGLQTWLKLITHWKCFLRKYLKVDRLPRKQIKVIGEKVLQVVKTCTLFVRSYNARKVL